MGVLVTGATGFIGGRLVCYLIEQGEEVSYLTRNTADTLEIHAAA